MHSGDLFFLFVCILVPLLNASVSSDAQYVTEDPLSEEECREIGFTPNLKCNTCNLLPKFNLEEITTDCQRCCAKEAKEEEHERYPFAEMEICECNLHRFPQITAFVRGDMKDQWGNKLRIRHVRGALPTIALKGEDGQTQKSLNVEKWDTDTLTEFLNDWLE
ncbi:sep15/SelM redox domain-containing protein [Ditylenchus destructor]|nr:sep15/SelM redox domain-containing protein [Ditylenchus destructor]